MDKKILVLIIFFILLAINTNQVTALLRRDTKSPSLDIIKNLSNEKFFDLQIRIAMLKAKMPSLSVCIIKNESVVWYNGYGLSRMLPFKKPNINTVYSIGSCSKIIAAAALMQLYDLGKFDLDDDINDYLNFSVHNPKYPKVPVTFRMLLAHQSSLQKQTEEQKRYLVYLFYRNNFEYPYPLIKELITPPGNLYTSEIWEEYPPGERANYSNIGITLVEHLVEVIANESYRGYCQKNIFDRLEMNNTSFNFADIDRNKLAIPYYKIAGMHIRIPMIDLPYATGGIKTSVEDLSHFLIAHMNHGKYKGISILNNTTVDIMHKIQYPNSNTCRGNHRYGLGWIYWDTEDEGGLYFEGHAGHSPLGTTLMMMNSSENIGVIWLINNGVPLSRSFVRNAWDQLGSIIVKKALYP